jgi:hypothetical protein
VHAGGAVVDDPDLAAIVEAWTSRPVDVRAEIARLATTEK